MHRLPISELLCSLVFTLWLGTDCLKKQIEASAGSLSPSLGLFPVRSHSHSRRAATHQTTAISLVLFTAYSSVSLPSGSRVQAVHDLSPCEHRFSLCSSFSGPVCCSPSLPGRPSALRVPCLKSGCGLWRKSLLVPPARTCMPCPGGHAESVPVSS